MSAKNGTRNRIEATARQILGLADVFQWRSNAQHYLTNAEPDASKDDRALITTHWVGKQLWDLPEDADQQQQLRKRLAVHKPLERMRFRVRHAGQELVDIDLSGLPVFAPSGAFQGYEGVWQVAHRRLISEMETRRIKGLELAVKKPIIVTDRSGLIEWVSPAFTTLTGYALEEVVGKTPGSFLQCAETDPETVLEIGTAVRAGQPIRRQILNQRKTGEQYWFDVSIQPIAGADGTCEGFVAVQPDVTDLVRAREQFRDLLVNLPAGVIHTDETGLVVDCNLEACRILNKTREALLSRSLTDAIVRLFNRDGSALHSRQNPALRILENGDRIENEVFGIGFADGQKKFIRVSSAPTWNVLEQRQEHVFSFIDVTQDEEGRQRLEQTTDLLHEVVETIPDALAAFDADDRLILFNENYLKTYQASAPAIKLGARFEDILRYGLEHGQYGEVGDHPEDKTAWLSQRLAAHTAKTPPKALQKLGNDRWLQIRERRSASGTVVGVRTDITSLKRAEENARIAARTDSLTGLSNRRVLLDVLEGGARQKDRCCALFLIDLDHFKLVNDTYGHEAGDALLCVTAERLRQLAGPEDLCVRLGGDEFALFVASSEPAQDLPDIAGRIMSSLNRPVELCGRTYRPVQSIGGTLIETEPLDADAIVRHADAALYAAKQAGGGVFRLFDADIGQRQDRFNTLAQALKSTVVSDGIDVVFQPQVDVVTGRISGFEALARWTLNRTAIPPFEFVQVAEDTGLGEALGTAIMTKVLHLARRFLLPPGSGVTIALNLATSQLRSARFFERLILSLEANGVSPSSLELEIPETVLLDRHQGEILNNLRKARSLGIGVALDDFGTGFASLSHVTELPLTGLKLDKSFVRRMKRDRGSAVIAGSIIAMAKGLDLSCVAEGVETEDELHFLRDLGCTLVQGYYTGRPVPAAVAADLL